MFLTLTIRCLAAVAHPVACGCPRLGLNVNYTVIIIRDMR
jgi:hypothetical protein